MKFDKNVISENKIIIGKYIFSFGINPKKFNKCIFEIKENNNIIVLIYINDNEMLNIFRYLYLIRNENILFTEIMEKINNIIESNIIKLS